MTEQLKTNALYVFATEVIHGAYKPEELKDAAMRAIRHHSAQPAPITSQVLTDEEIDAAYEQARANYQRSRFAVRGQQLTAQDSTDWWFARAIEQAVRAKMGVAQWIACEDQMPEPGTECLVYVKALSPKQDGPTHYTHIDIWDEQHEAPVSWSSATIPVGLGWGSFDFEDVTHWMKLPPPPGIVGEKGGA